jgi:hypothetical protein
LPGFGTHDEGDFDEAHDRTAERRSRVVGSQGGRALAQSAAPAASAPSAGMGAGMRGWRMSRDDTPGWSMMTRAERREHHDKMVSMTDTSCKAYMEQHHTRMIERARTKGLEAPGKPRHDACDRLKK